MIAPSSKSGEDCLETAPYGGANFGGTLRVTPARGFVMRRRVRLLLRFPFEIIENFRRELRLDNPNPRNACGARQRSGR